MCATATLTEPIIMQSKGWDAMCEAVAAVVCFALARRCTCVSGDSLCSADLGVTSTAAIVHKHNTNMSGTRPRPTFLQVSDNPAALTNFNWLISCCAPAPLLSPRRARRLADWCGLRAYF